MPAMSSSVRIVPSFPATAAHGVRLVDAAFRFPLLHRAVLSVIPGGQGVAEMDSNLAAAGAVIPAALWADLKAQGLLREDAPA